MSVYHASTMIGAPSDEVFRFLSSVSSARKYLPNVLEIHPEFDDRVWMVVEEETGARHEFSGFFRVSEKTRRVDFGSNGNLAIVGYFELLDKGPMSTRLTLYVASEPSAGFDPRIHQAVESVLASIRRIIEEEGGGQLVGTA